jgi:RNA polymerase sigma-54 factor
MKSTVSRVTTNKYAHTPQGIFELKYFFNSSISRVQGDAVASESVKERIRRLIVNEDPRRPLSDQRIAEMLRVANIDIARRTGDEVPRVDEPACLRRSEDRSARVPARRPGARR